MTDEMFVALQLRRTVLRPQKRNGRVERVPKLDELPVQGVLSRRERLLLITGEAGSGKSTSLRRLAFVLVEKSLKSPKDEAQIPVLFRAAQIVSGKGTTLVDLAAAETIRLTDSERPAFTADDLRGGRVTLLVDGLDELADDDARADVLERIQEFHDANSKCQVIVTSREYSFLNILPAVKAFVRFRLSPISYKQAEKILTRVQARKQLSIENSKELLRRIQQVHGIELNPLLVTVFAATSDYSRKDIPANITELFKKYTEMMLGRWDATKGLGQQYQAPLKDFVLCRVAFEMHRREVAAIDIQEFKRVVTAELAARGHEADIDELSDEMLHRSGLFRIIGDSVEFRHLLLQEFFAGRGIPSADFIESKVSSEWWQKAIVFYFGQNPGDGRTLNSVVSAVTIRPLPERFKAAITIGLALQACYLVEVKDKVDVAAWVLSSLADAKDAFIADAESKNVRPITAFIWYYVFGRDAAAFNLPEVSRREVLQRLLDSAPSEEGRQTRQFWFLAGLIESGLVEIAEPLTKRFHPDDPRLSLGLHLGCFLLEHLRVADRDQRNTAGRIRDRIQGQIAPLREQLFQEFRTELIEVQEGQVKALPGFASTSSERRADVDVNDIDVVQEGGQD